MAKKSLSKAWLDAGIQNCLHPPVVKIDAERSEFLDHIREVSKQVEKWPSWKKNQLGAEYMLKNFGGEDPRPDINFSEIVEEEEPDFDSPNGSVWVVAVDECGMVSVLKSPNIHYGFFDNGNSAEEIGLPCESEKDPGVYRWVCNVHGGQDDFTGEYWGPEFSVEKEELLWSPEDA